MKLLSTCHIIHTWDARLRQSLETAFLCVKITKVVETRSKPITVEACNPKTHPRHAISVIGGAN